MLKALIFVHQVSAWNSLQIVANYLASKNIFVTVLVDSNKYPDGKSDDVLNHNNLGYELLATADIKISFIEKLILYLSGSWICNCLNRVCNRVCVKMHNCSFSLDFKLYLKLYIDHRIASNVISKIDPDFVILGCDRSGGVLAVISACRNAGVQSFIIPFAIQPTKENIIERRYKLESHVIHTEDKKFRNKFSEQIRIGNYKDLSISFYPKMTTATLNLIGMLPSKPYRIGGGQSDVLMVSSEYDKQMAMDQGIIESKISVVGYPEYDLLYESFMRKEELRKQLNRRHGFAEGGKLLVVSLPQLAEHKILPWDEHWIEIKYICFCVAQCDANVIISLHPKMVYEEYACLATKYDVIISEEPLRSLLPLCDVSVSAEGSSTVLWARACNIPVVVLSWFGIHCQGYGDLKNAFIVRDRKTLAVALDEAIVSQCHGENSIKLEVFKFDGMVRDRIIDVIRNRLS